MCITGKYNCVEKFDLATCKGLKRGMCVVLNNIVPVNMAQVTIEAISIGVFFFFELSIGVGSPLDLIGMFILSGRLR